VSDLVGFDADVLVGLSATGLRIESLVSTGLRRGDRRPEAELADQERILPPLAEGEVVPVTGAEAKGTTPSRPTATPKRR